MEQNNFEILQDVLETGSSFPKQLP